MLDPRIYRMGLVVVALAVIVVAFSLGDQQPGLGTTLAPEAFNGQDAYATMTKLAARYPRRPPGSAADRAIADYVAAQLRRDGFAVSTDDFSARTVDGTRSLRTVTGTLAGLTNGSIVVVAGRDALAPPSTAGLSGTGVLLELAHDLSGETQRRSIVLTSTSGTLGEAGVTRLARTIPGPVDAVIVLGDLAATEVHQPVLAPWSDTTLVAPTVLRNTLATALGAQAGLAPGGTSLPGQVLHLALPLAVGGQAPFIARGEPAIALSLSGARPAAPNEPTSAGRITALGRAVLQTAGALSAGATIAAPSGYLLWSGKVVPLWAVRLLVLALIVPVLGAVIDGLARARRRGHAVIGWLVWALSAAAPFAAAAVAVVGLRALGLIDVAPPGPVDGAAIEIHAFQISVIALLACLIAAGFAVLRPVILGALVDPEVLDDASGPGAAAAVLLVLCAVAILLWLANPFTAALIVPGLHLWTWAVGTRVRPPRLAMTALILAGLAVPAAAIVYYARTLGLGPADTVWSAVQQLAGGSVGLGLAIESSLVLGCLTSLGLITVRSTRGAKRPEEVPVTVRGPVTYAGPGSLGGTRSALRR
jgi:hypothetical protein